MCPRSLTIPPSPAASHWLQRAVSSALQAGSPPGPVSPHSLSEPQRRAGRAAQHLTSASQGPNHGSRSSFKPASRPLSPRRPASSLTVTGQLLSPWYEDTRRCRLPVPGSQSTITTPIVINPSLGTLASQIRWADTRRRPPTLDQVRHRLLSSTRHTRQHHTSRARGHEASTIARRDKR